MPVKENNRVCIDPVAFNYILRSNGIFVKNLSDKQSKYYCGVSYSTIANGIYEKHFSKRTYKLINRIVNIDNCVVKNPGEKAAYQETIMQINSLIRRLNRSKEKLLIIQQDINDILVDIDTLTNSLKEEM